MRSVAPIAAICEMRHGLRVQTATKDLGTLGPGGAALLQKGKGGVMNTENQGKGRGSAAAQLLNSARQAVGFARLPLLLGLILIVGFSLVYWSAAWLFSGNAPAQREYSALVQFNFPGADRGLYPNGSAFTSTDLLSPVVLARVIDQLELSVTPEQLAARLQVVAHAPRTREVQREYQQRLSDSSLSRAELQELEAQFRTELQRATLGRARLIFIQDQLTNTSDWPAQQILQRVPAVWAEYVLNEAGFFEEPLDLLTADVVRASVIGSLDYMLVYDRFGELFAALRDNLALLREQPNSGRVRSLSRPMTLSDIEASANELENFVLEDALLPVLTEGLSAHPEATVQFFRERMRELARQQALMEARAERVEQVLADYGSAANSGVRAGGAEASRLGQQFGSEFLNRLVQLGADSGEMDFRQTLSRERLDFVLSAANRGAEIERLGRLVQRIEGELAGRNQVADAVDLEATRQQLEHNLQRIRTQLEELFVATEEIAQQLDRNRFSGGAALYSLNVSNQAEVAARVFAPAALTWYQLGLMAMLMLALLLAVAYQLWPRVAKS